MDRRITLLKYLRSQKKGYLLRNIITKNLREGRASTAAAENYPRDDQSREGLAKRARMTLGRSFSSSVSIPATSTTSIASVGTDAGGPDEGSQSLFKCQQKTPSSLKTYELHTTSLRSQISRFFGTAPDCRGIPCQLEPVNPDCDSFDPLQKTVDEYALEIFSQEMTNEAVNYPPTCTKEAERQLSKRRDAVSGVRKLGIALKLIYQTIHMAVYIVDAFLRVQTLPLYSVELFSAGAVFIAAKQEETDFTLTAESILKHCSPTGRYTPKRLVAMEAKILNKLKFKICCPTSQFFMTTCASQMTYPNALTKKFTIELAECLLFYSLGENELMFCSNSKKARLALYYAVKYVCYNYKLLENVHGTDKGIWDKFRIKCFPEFKSAVLHGVSLPKSLGIYCPSPKSAVALRDTTNKGKGCRRHSLSRSCTTISSTSRTTYIK